MIEIHRLWSCSFDRLLRRSAGIKLTISPQLDRTCWGEISVREGGHKNVSKKFKYLSTCALSGLGCVLFFFWRFFVFERIFVRLTRGCVMRDSRIFWSVVLFSLMLAAAKATSNLCFWDTVMQGGVQVQVEGLCLRLWFGDLDSLSRIEKDKPLLNPGAFINPERTQQCFSRIVLGITRILFFRSDNPFRSIKNQFQHGASQVSYLSSSSTEFAEASDPFWKNDPRDWNHTLFNISSYKGRFSCPFEPIMASFQANNPVTLFFHFPVFDSAMEAEILPIFLGEKIWADCIVAVSRPLEPEFHGLSYNQSGNQLQQDSLGFAWFECSAFWGIDQSRWWTSLVRTLARIGFSLAMV